LSAAAQNYVSLYLERGTDSEMSAERDVFGSFAVIFSLYFRFVNGFIRMLRM
jgi:hypothetical protein